MMMEIRLRLLALTTAFLCFVSGSDVFAEDLSVEEIAERYEAQWNDVNALRIEFRRESQTRTASSSYDACSWEMVGEKAKVVESRLTSVLSNPLDTDSPRLSANVISVCYFDGEKTREIAEPADSYPIDEFNLKDYEDLRRRGFRAVISNLNKHWRFWYSCPIPRYFSIPTETELISLPDLVAKYDARVVKRTRSERGDELVQIEIRDDAVDGAMSEFFKSWALYISLNVTKNYAVAGFQLNVTLNRDPESKVISDYTAGSFKEFPRGIWIPTTVAYREHSGGVRSSLTKISIRGVSINVPSTDFDQFHFKPGMVVHEEIWPEIRENTERPEILVHLWGDDDSSAQTFESEEDFREYYEENFGLDSLDEVLDPRFKIMERRRSGLLFLGACVCLGAFILLTLYTRRAVRRDREEENA